MQRKYRVLRLAALTSIALAGAAIAQQDQQQATPPATPNPEQGTNPQTSNPPPDSATPTGVPGGTSAEPRKAAEEEIVVTGSRVRRKDLTTPAPVTVINREQITASGIAAIGDFLQQLPEQGNALNTNVNNGGDGTTQVSLRNLGAQRTLVLVDGKRWVNGGTNAGLAPDLNSIPSAAIERVEVLKDGASAVYGSDAIAGVVNIITRRRVNGTELSAYAGTSSHGDGTQYDINVSTGVAADKGSFFFTGGYFDQSSMLAADRDWAKSSVTFNFANHPNGSPAIAARSTAPAGSSRIPQGRAGINLGIHYKDSAPHNADGSPAAPNDPNNYELYCTTAICGTLRSAYFPGKTQVSDFYTIDGTGTLDVTSGNVNVIYDPTAATAVAGTGFRRVTSKDVYNYQAVNFLITPSKRISLFSNGDYHITDFARAYIQASYNNRQSSYLIAPEPLDTGTFNSVYSATNAYNPFGVDLPDVRRRLIETGGRGRSFDLDTLGGTFWDLSFSYGRTSGTDSTQGSLNTQFTTNAMGPSFVDAAGVPHCGTAAQPIPNCTPANLLHNPGPGDPTGALTPEMLTSLGGYQGINRGFIQLATVQANVSQELFPLLADRPIGLAAGYEFRRHYASYVPNAIAQLGLDTDFNGAPTAGAYKVHEGYAELNVPVVSHMDYAEDVELTGAFRLFNYSSFGTDSTYKLGARWRPVRDVTIRGTYSTGFRAPDVADLFGGQQPSAESASDPCATGIVPGSEAARQCRAAVRGGGGVLAPNNGDDANQINSTVGGNTGLKPEKAKMWTVGAVFEPSMVRNLSVTVDYWNVNVTQVLGFNTTAVILSGCYPAASGLSAPPNQAFCNLITRQASTGRIIDVQDLETNVGQFWTTGIDLAARYGFPATDFGRFGLLFDGTYLIKYDYSVASGKVYHSAGNYDAGSGTAQGILTPRVKFNAGVNYGLAGLNAGLRTRFISGFKECANKAGTSTGDQVGGPGYCTDNIIDPVTNKPYPGHDVAPYVTFDVYLSYALRNPAGTTTLSAGIRNLADRKPSTVYNAFLTYADPGYDFVGRFFYGRLSHQF